MWERSTSVEAAASVEASGFIWSISGQTADAAPIAPTAPVAMNKKSRRVGSTLTLSVKAFPRVFHGLFALAHSFALLSKRSNASFRHFGGSI
jgi:hypothetical protein